MELSQVQRAELNGLIVCTACDLLHENYAEIIDKVRIVCTQLPQEFTNERITELVDQCVRQMSLLSIGRAPVRPDHDSKLVCSVVHGTIGVLLAANHARFVQRVLFVYKGMLDDSVESQSHVDAAVRKAIDVAMQRMVSPPQHHTRFGGNNAIERCADLSRQLHIDVRSVTPNNAHNHNGNSEQQQSRESSIDIRPGSQPTIDSESCELSFSGKPGFPNGNVDSEVESAGHSDPSPTPNVRFNHQDMIESEYAFDDNRSLLESSTSQMTILMFDGKRVTSYDPHRGRPAKVDHIVDVPHEFEAFLAHPAVLSHGSIQKVYLESETEHHVRLAEYDHTNRSWKLLPKFTRMTELIHPSFSDFLTPLLCSDGDLFRCTPKQATNPLESESDFDDIARQHERGKPAPCPLQATIPLESGVHAFGNDVDGVVHEVLHDSGSHEWEFWDKDNCKIGNAGKTVKLHSDCSHTVLGDCVYFFGGTDHGLDTTDAAAYNLLSHSWHACRSIPKSLSHHACARGPTNAQLLKSNASNCIYVSGGWHNGKVKDRCKRYDTNTDQWLDAGRLKTSRRDHQMLTLDQAGALLVIGGLTDMLAPIHTVERYDVVTEKWMKVDDGAQLRAWYAGAVVINEYSKI